MTKKMINYQQIYEDEVSETAKESMELPRGFFELDEQKRRLVEEMIDRGYQRAIDDALDREVLNETAALCAEMGTQLYNFANVIGEYIDTEVPDRATDD
jgi:hypothetical protein